MKYFEKNKKILKFRKVFNQGNILEKNINFPKIIRVYKGPQKFKSNFSRIFSKSF